MSPFDRLKVDTVCNVATPSLLAKECMQCRHPILASQKVYAMSPPDPCLPKSVCKVATWPYLKIVETGLGFIWLWSIKFWMSSWKKTDTTHTMVFFQNYHNVKHACICNVAMDNSQIKTYMQCRHLPLAFQTEYAMSPPATCAPTRVCNVAMWPLPFQTDCNQIPLQSDCNLKITIWL